MQTIKNVIRSLVLWVCSVFVTNAIVFGIPLSALSLHITNSSTVKSWLAETDSYQNILSQSIYLIDQTSIDGQDKISIGQSIEDNTNLDITGLQNQVITAIDPTNLKMQFETAIDSIYDWLNKTAERPDFTISIAADSEKLRTNLTNELSTQLEDLPTCSISQLTKDNILNATCTPPGISSDFLAASYIDSILDDSGFMGDAAFSSDELEITDDISDAAQSGFSFLKNVRWFSVGVFLLASSVILTIARPGKAKGLNIVGRSMVSSSIFMGIAAFFASRIDSLPFSTSLQNSSQSEAVQKMIEPFLLRVTNDVSSTIFGYALIVLVLGIVALLVSKALKRDGQMHPSLKDHNVVDPGAWE